MIPNIARCAINLFYPLATRTMIFRIALTCVLAAESLATSLPDIFGEPDSESPVPRNTARYLLELETQDIYLHYCGHLQLFSLRFSPKLKNYLQNVAKTDNSSMWPAVYPVNKLSSQGTFDWQAEGVPRWSPTSGADSKHVFYGREVRGTPNALYGNSIHLVLGPEADPEGWSVDEMNENRNFSKAILEGMPVVTADQAYRHFRREVAPTLGSDFKKQYGAGITTKAHRFALQMYSASSPQVNQPEDQYFEMFPGAKPPTENVMFLEAEDGCKGTPSPRTHEKITMEKDLVSGVKIQLPAFHAFRLCAVAGLISIFLAALVALRRHRVCGQPQFGTLLTDEVAGE